MAGSATTVLIADDEPDVRAVLGRLLEAADGIRVVGSAADAEEAARLAAESRPDVALVDFDLPGGGEQTVRGILQSSPSTRVVALSGAADSATTLAMLGAGAASYLVKGGSPDAIVAAVIRAARGESTFAAEVAGDLIGELSARLERSRLEGDEADHVRTRIRGVIDGGRIRPVYQPIVELATGRTVGFEALSRFDDVPARPPQEWFEQAESIGLRAELETAAARLAVDGFAGRAGGEFLTVNASPDSLSDLEYVARELGDRFVVEITEHRAIDDYAAITRRLRRLRERGARLAVDDAGAGFASFRHVLELAPDFVKLDISLTRGVATDRRRRALARGLVAFADELAIAIVAEGIESQSELDALLELGVGLGQGWLFGVPGPLPEAPPGR